MKPNDVKFRSYIDFDSENKIEIKIETLIKTKPNQKFENQNLYSLYKYFMCWYSEYAINK